MRAPLFYTLKRAWWAGGWDVMRVTSENKGKLYGSVDNNGMHCRERDTRGRFATEDEARDRIAAVEKIVALTEPGIAEKQRAYIAAQEAQRKAIEDVVSGPVKPKEIAE